MPLTNFPNGVTSFGIPMVMPGVPIPNVNGKVLFVDGTYGADGNKGTDPKLALSTIARAIALANPGDTIFVFPKVMAATDTDPGSYAESVTIDVPQVSLLGVARGRTQGGLPQLKVGTTTTSPIITVAAPAVLIANVGVNGAGATGGGILFDDDGGATGSSFGGAVTNCHFKNCKGSTATNAATGGAVQLSGAPFQIYIGKNRFYNNVGGIVLLDTSNAVPQDVVIEGNRFGGEAASTDVDIYGAGGSGFGVGLTIFRNVFEEKPALGSASTARWMDLTGADGGIVAGNFFGEDLTHGSAGTGSFIPATVNFSGNYDAGGLATTA